MGVDPAPRRAATCRAHLGRRRRRIIGFVGNELVAVYRIRGGHEIGSAALVADGPHARTDGFTSLAVVGGALGVLAGIPLADPIVGLLVETTVHVSPDGPDGGRQHALLAHHRPARCTAQPG